MSKVTRYKSEYIEKVDEYLKKSRDKEVGRVKSGLMILKVQLPTIEGFAGFLGVARKSLYNWEKTHPDFARALERIKTEQLTRLINRGLEGSYNPTIAKLMLSSNHDMREKTDVTSDDEPLNTFTDDQINRIAARVARRAGSNGDTPS